MSVEELKLKMYEASAAKSAIEREEWEYRSERETKFREALNEELRAKFGERLQAARDAERAANEAHSAEVERIALTGEGLKWPIGTVMAKWERHRYYGRTTPPMQLTGERGVVEVITATSQHPDNISSYSQASRGDVVIRLLKKDGTPSKKYSRRGWEMDKFYPVGVDANKAQEKETA